MNGRRSPIEQVVVALLGGALVTASVVPLLFLVLGTFIGGGIGMLFAFIAFIIATPVSLAHALALGLPCYLLLSRLLPLSRIGAAMAGFAIGALPIWLQIYSFPVMADPSVVPGALVRAAGGCGLLGAIGGLAFHHILQRLADDGDEAAA